MYAHLTNHAAERCDERGIDKELVLGSIREFEALKGMKVVWKIRGHIWAVTYFYHNRAEVVTVFDRKDNKPPGMS